LRGNGKRRPYKFSTLKQKKFLELLEQGSRRYAAAEAVGISGGMISYHMKRDKNFAKAVDEAEMNANQIIEGALFDAAVSGNVTACLAWLYSRDPNRWQDKRNIQGKIEGKVLHAHLHQESGNGKYANVPYELIVKAKEAIEECRAVAGQKVIEVESEVVEENES